MLRKIIFLLAAFGLFFPLVAQGVFLPVQGGTGISSTVAGDIGKTLVVSSSSPFTYSLSFRGTTSGTGTINYFPFWTATSTLASTSSLFQNASGNIGLATTTPEFRLSLDNDGSIIALGSSTINFDNGVNANPIGATLTTTGPGDKMFWYARQAAFRAGVISTTTPNAWDDANIGFGSAAFGSDNLVSGLLGFSAGAGNQVTGIAATALGIQNVSQGTDSFAAGSGSSALSDDSFALGSNNLVNNTQSGAMGDTVVVTGTRSFGLGQSLTITGNNVFAAGQQSTVGGNNAFAIGTNDQVTGVFAGALGYFDYANGPGSFAFGNGMAVSSTATGSIGFSLADPTDVTNAGAPLYTVSQAHTLAIMGGDVGIGMTAPTEALTISSGNFLITNGWGEIGSVNFITPGLSGSLAVGSSNSLTASSSAVFGNSNDVSSTATLVGGSNNIVVGDTNFGAGSNNTVSGSEGFFGGNNNTLSNTASTVFGQSNSVSGQGDFAAGQSNIVTSDFAAAFGGGQRVAGDHAFAVGQTNTVNGSAAMAFGDYNKANGDLSAVIGSGSEADGLADIALGTRIMVSSTASSSIGISLGSQPPFYPATPLYEIDQSHTLAIMGGDVGIGTTTPNGFEVATTSNFDGEVNVKWGTPSTTNCGTGASVTGSNHAAVISVGTGISVTSCEEDFSPNFTTTPVCVESDNSVAITGDINSVSTSSVVFNFSASLGGGKIYVHCF